jgi:hypothetical protein
MEYYKMNMWFCIAIFMCVIVTYNYETTASIMRPDIEDNTDMHTIVINDSNRDSNGDILIDIPHTLIDSNTQYNLNAVPGDGTNFTFTTVEDFTITNSLSNIFRNNNVTNNWQIPTGSTQDTHLDTLTPVNTTNGEYYWLVDGIIVSGNMIILGDIMMPIGDNIATRTGTDVIIVKNPTSPRPYWDYAINFIGTSNTDLAWNIAIILADTQYAYIYGLQTVHTEFTTVYNVVISRILGTDLASQNHNSIQYYTNANTWSSTSDDLKPVITGYPVSESHVHYSTYMKLYYILICTVSNQNDVRLGTSPNPWGPWTITSLYSYPLPSDDDIVLDKYACRSYPEFANGSNEIVFTYNVNVVVGGNASAYDVDIPTFVRLVIEHI